MTWKKRLSTLIALAAFVSFAAGAQEMTKEEWQKQIQENTAKRDQLKSRLAALQTDVEKLKQQDSDKALALRKCEDEIMAMVGATNETVRSFENEFERLNRRLDELARLSNQDLWSRAKELDDLRAATNDARENKMSAIPEYYDRLQDQLNRLEGLRKSLDAAMMAMTYTVGTWAKDRDCLWNIAKKPTIYDNAFLWPKIWQGNRDQIKNPDIIYPGQKLKVPPKAELTAEENSAVKNYWQKKQAATMDNP